MYHISLFWTRTWPLYNSSTVINVRSHPIVWTSLSLHSPPPTPISNYMLSWTNCKSTLYHDTNNVVCVSKAKNWLPELSEFLGWLTNNLNPQDYTVKFVSGGPKTYGYRTLHHANIFVVNLASLMGLVDNVVHQRDNTQEQNIVRDKWGFFLKTTQ